MALYQINRVKYNNVTKFQKDFFLLLWHLRIKMFFLCSGLRSLKELRKKFLQSEALKKKCCLSESSSEFISFSGTAKKFSSSFGEHVSFGSFLTLRKEQ
jgi:hypothetical protein